MLSLTDALAAWMCQPVSGALTGVVRKWAVCMSITREVDSFAARGTAWDENLTIDGHTYYSTSGGSVSDIQSEAALNVDNAECRFNFDLITSEDLQAGLWDDAEYELFVVNADDTTMGRRTIMAGTLGQITIDRLQFVTELRSRMQNLQQTFGRLTSATCPHTLGDAECTKDLTDFTVTGTLEGVSDDGLTFFDSARTEAGPADPVAIDDIERGTETWIDLPVTAASLNLVAGSTITLSDIDGPNLLNGPWSIAEVNGSRIRIPIDTSDSGTYPAFVSGNLTPEGADSSYWAYGLFTITSGDNAGLTPEIKTSVPGQWTLQQALPFFLAGTETYSMVAGCDKKALTCRVKFDNYPNFGGEDKMRGNDWMISSLGRAE